MNIKIELTRLKKFEVKLFLGSKKFKKKTKKLKTKIFIKVQIENMVDLH